MSEAAARRKTRMPAPEPAAKTPARRRWTVVVRDAGSGAAADGHIPAARLREAAMRPRPLPHRTELEARFGAALGGIVAVSGPDVEAFLTGEDALAATVGGRLLVSTAATLPIVAHEVAHILQQRAVGSLDPAERAEDEALRVEARVAAGRPVPAIEAGLFPGALAFRRTDAPLQRAEIVVADDPQASREFAETADLTASEPEAGASATPGADEAAGEAAAQVATEAAGAAPAAAGPQGGALDEAAADLGDDVPDVAVPTFELAPMPELAVDEEAAAAATAEAEAALEGAEDADAMMTAFKDAPPSVKAAQHDRLEGRAGELAAQDEAAFEQEMPAFGAEMSGTGELSAPAAVQTPETREAALEAGAPPPAPEPTVDPTPDAGAADLNRSGQELLVGLFEPGDAGGLGRAFSRISTSDAAVDASAGERPGVPLEGATDPQRVADQDAAARADAVESRRQASQAVIDGPGPEQVRLHALDEQFAMEARAAPEIAPAEGPVEGAAAFRAKELDPEVTALFDAHHGAAMAASMAEAEGEVSAAVATRDSEREAELATAQAERDRLNAEADTAQQQEVTSRRQDVQDARQTAVDAQAGHVSDLEADADTRRQVAQTEIDDQVTDTEAQVATSFSQAETRAEDEVSQGERRADDERARREREAEDQSWWDRATAWVAEQFDRLTAFINDVFDAVRAAVRDIIDAVKEAAIALIDAAAAAITSAIEAVGEALKAAVNTLLAEHFPAVAAALNSAIDGAVEIATTAVNTIAEGLKTAVSALLDALAAGLDAILAAYQGAMNAALAIARAALTGDWAELARLILEPVLLALGIDPAAFYEMIARAMQALDIIIDDPVGFLSNLVEGVVGGVRRFGGNLFTHLQAGIIGWLTGALGGDIQIPERWDLMGVLDLARQILGLTVDMLRRIAVRVLGEAAVERIEFFMGYVVELVTGGFAALWERIVQDLGNLADMVLEAIKSFLLERVVMAAITWLASLFSPVGALVKLVMTIWNFLMFLKDQLTRIIEVVQTVVGALYDIATGVLEPAIRGVESVLGRLLPIAIDLLARLLGLGDVAGRVRRIISDVRQRIEDAIVRLINRVLAAFTGGRRGGGRAAADGPAEGADDADDLMRPIAFGAGGERHVLYLHEEAGGAVPMMRSTPTPIETWLVGLRGDGVARIGAQKEPAWTPQQIAEKRTEIAPLIVSALAEEGQLDAAGDAAERAEEAAPASSPPPPAPQLAAEGQELAGALSRILEKLGLSADVDLEARFADGIARLHADLAGQLRSNVVSRLDARLYGALEWRAAVPMIAHERQLPVAWERPCASDGIVRRVFDADYRTAIVRIVEAQSGPVFSGDANSESLTNFLNRHLTQALNQPANAQRIVQVLLENRGGGGVAAAMSDTIRDVSGRAFAEGLEHDYRFTTVTGTYYRDVLVPRAHEILENSNFGEYFEEEDKNVVGTGGGEQKPLTYFLSRSKRASKNRQRLADAVRGAHPAQHEWIPSRLASEALLGAARELEETGHIDALKGATEVLEFQHKVRTPTLDLIFRPGAGFPAAEQTVIYKATAHRDSEQYADTPMNQLPAALRDQWYPPTSPREGDRLGILQGHPGAIYAYAQGGAHSTNITQQVVGHSEWNATLEGKVTEKVDELVYFRDVREMGLNILDFYAETVWRGDRDPTASGGRFFPLYFRSRSESDAVRYDALKSTFGSEFGSVYLTLEAQIRDVVSR